jgi:hypothetical protein
VDKEARLFEMNGGKRLEKMFADLEARYLALVSEDHPEELTDPYAAMYAVMARAQTGKQDRKKRSSLARRAWEKISLVVPGHWAGRHPDDPLAVVEEHQQAPDGDGCG